MKKTIAHINIRSLALALGATALVAGAIAAAPKATAPAPRLEVDETPVARAAGPHISFAPIVKKVTPAVVKIVVTAKASQNSPPGWFGFDDPFWRRFFGDRFGNPSPNPAPGRQFRIPRQFGLGSGVIITKDGYILTNNHVVDGADEVKVTLQDRRELTAKVIGRDPKSDIAVIKVEAQDLPFVPMASSDKVEVGDLVLAIGNPFGVGQTVTTGIVSATGRGNLGIEEYEDFIQTDAAINPGNSGGALVDVEGRLIGINTAIYSRSGGNQGIGFAIPSNLARNVMDSLVKYGHVSRGYLGIMIQDVTPSLAKAFKLPDANGALIDDVVSGGPADKAGLKNGDVVIEYNGKKVRDSRHLNLTLAKPSPAPGCRESCATASTRTLEVPSGTCPTIRNRAIQPFERRRHGTLNGVTVSDLDARARRQFDIPESVKGVIVTDLEPDSAAAEAGLKPGDVIQEINRTPVKTAEEAVRLTERPRSKVTMMRVWRNGGSRYMVVDESKSAREDNG